MFLLIFEVSIRTSSTAITFLCDLRVAIAPSPINTNLKKRQMTGSTKVIKFVNQQVSVQHLLFTVNRFVNHCVHLVTKFVNQQQICNIMYLHGHQICEPLATTVSIFM